MQGGIGSGFFSLLGSGRGGFLHVPEALGNWGFRHISPHISGERGSISRGSRGGSEIEIAIRLNVVL